MLVNVFRKVTLSRYCTSSNLRDALLQAGVVPKDGNDVNPEAKRTIRFAEPLAMAAFSDAPETPEDPTPQTEEAPLDSLDESQETDPVFRDRVAARVGLYEAPDARSLSSI